VGAADLAESLAAQLVSPVRFTATLTGMAATGIGTFVHLGPGDVTAGMVKRAVPDATVHVANDLASVDAITSELKGS
jgi:[acyl-carrier-protein] S-malonyltransferase